MDERTWEGLLSTALGVVDEIESRGHGALDIVVGGGTVLMMRMHHRVSKDVDIFLHDVQWLSWLTPRLNDRPRLSTDILALKDFDRLVPTMIETAIGSIERAAGAHWR